MRYLRAAGLVVVVAAMMIGAGSASATVLTNKDFKVIGVGEEIHALGATSLDGTINIACQRSTASIHITDAGGPGPSGITKTVKGKITSLTFSECGNHTVEVLKPGELEVHSIGGNAGKLSSVGTEVTVLTHSIFLGTRHCIFVGENEIGTLTGSGFHTTPTLDVKSGPLGRVDTDSLCGDDAQWTGTYEIFSPDHIYVDPIV